MDPAAIHEQLGRVARSRTFANKSQLRKLLEVLHKSMDSQAALTTELVIQELWPTETKTKHAKDVATEMNRLRHAMESYYKAEGKTDPVIIYFPKRAPSVDGFQETRWIDAMLRNGEEAHTSVALPSTATAQAPKPQPLGQVHGHQTWKRAALIAVLCAILSLVGYFWFRAVGKPDQPKVGRLDGSALVIMNAEGKELWRKVFPEGFGPDSYYSQGLSSRLWFADLEGKGQTSVLFSYLAGEGRSSTLICYTDRGKEKWRWAPGRDLPEWGGSPPTFATFALNVLRATEKRPSRVVVSSQLLPWWPDQIALLDANGKAISEYWHSGGLTSLVLADLNGDGREEIVATGVSIGYHQATLVVLDPDKLFGASEEAARPDLQIRSMGVAQESLRLLFPRSDLNKALYQFNFAAQPTIEHGNIRLAVWECLTPNPSCGIWYEFEKGFHLGTAYAGSDEFRSNHERFYQTGKGAHTLSAEEQAAFQKVRCLVGCESEFVPIGNLVPKSAHK